MNSALAPEEKKPKQRRLSKKQKGFIKDYIKTGDATQAVLNHYDSKPEVAHVIAYENLQKPLIIKTIQESLPDDLLAKVHIEGLEATRNGRISDDDWGEVPDHSTRHKYLDSAYKLKGLYAPEKSISVNVDIEPTEALKKLAHGLLDSQRRRLGSSERAVSEPLGSTTTDKE